ncbi:MAG: DUF3105 domain-containing protein [Propionibacteriales bacterium]|nr:DUF3105 domain-containing protein [Propionibacteriales bacterium]
MGKSSKAQERRARIERLERERKSAERKRMLLFSSVIAVIALGIIGATGWSLWQDRQAERQAEQRAEDPISEIGATEAQAGCDPVEQKPASGGGQHIPDGQPIEYPDTPPASGPHWDQWERFARTFYTADDRPDVERLVHNLEHGYSILWYDETIADDSEAMVQIQAIAKKYDGNERDPANAFIAVPWTSEDRGDLPNGKHLALTHWWVDPENNQQGEETAVSRYCERPSGAVVEQFMEDYPQSEAREPGAGFL